MVDQGVMLVPWWQWRCQRARCQKPQWPERLQGSGLMRCASQVYAPAACFGTDQYTGKVSGSFHNVMGTHSAEEAP